MRTLTIFAVLALSTLLVAQSYKIQELTKLVASHEARIATNQRTLENVVRDINKFELTSWRQILEEQ